MRDQWPAHATQEITIAFAPFRSVTSIRVYDRSDIASIVATSTYRVSAGDQGGRIRFTAAPPSPGRANDGIEIDFTFGYGSAPAQTPEPLRRAILLLVAFWREHRGDDTTLAALPPAAPALCAPYRRERLI